jgi:hypothetical protein
MEVIGYSEDDVRKTVLCHWNTTIDALKEEGNYETFSVGALFVTSDCFLRLEFAVLTEDDLQSWNRNDIGDGNRNGAADHRMLGHPI